MKTSNSNAVIAKTGGIWDYKNNEGIKAAGFDVKLLDDFGNFHFGIVANANGFNLETSLYGAGAFQVWRQKGGGYTAHLGGTSLMGITLGGRLLPDGVTTMITSLGYSWGDNPGDAINIMQGWHYYEENY